MEKVTVKTGNYELEVDEKFASSYSELKEYMSCWRSTLDEISDLITDVGSQDGEDVNYRSLFTLLRNVRDIRQQLDNLTAARVTVNGREVKDTD